MTDPDGRTVRGRLANTLLWLEVDEEEVRWQIFQDDFSFDAQGKLDPDGRIVDRTRNAAVVDYGTPGAMVLRKDRWGLPSSLYLDDMLCLENTFPCQSVGRASLELPLSCGPRPRWAFKGLSALDYLGVALFVVPPPFVVALGLIVGLFFSIFEARAARRFTRGHWWAMAALFTRVLLPVVAAGSISEVSWGWSLSVWMSVDTDAGRNPFILLRLGCLGLGQLLAAGGVAFRREDVPSGSMRAAPPVPVLLVLTAVFGLVLMQRVDPALLAEDPRARALKMLSTWGLLYLSVPVLLWLIIPRPLRRHLRLGGFATVIFVLGQLMVRKETHIQLLNVFFGVESWGGRGAHEEFSQLEARLASWMLLGLVMGGTALIVSVSNLLSRAASAPEGRGSH
ncbi:hypothetical protein BO221_29075 [Archangium sp. Cb G35]|nr:hypothetical protein BO221_29075 [Archangium sp. Cb G35]